MLWYNLELSCQKEKAFEIEEFLLGYGASSVSFSFQNNNEEFYELKPNETPLWELVKISAIFEKKISINNIHKILEKTDYLNLFISTFKDKNWVKSYQKNLVPMQFGKRVWIIPSWAKREAKLGDIIIKINPGMAFGTGAHETTHLCLEYLELQRPTNKVLIDYGCGSGVLAIAGIKLGAKCAIGIDIDSQALSIAAKNAVKNKVLDKILLTDDTFNEKSSGDILIANIFYNTLVELQTKFSCLLKAKGLLILSGVLVHQTLDIIKVFETEFQLKKTKKRNGWSILIFQKK